MKWEEKYNLFAYSVIENSAFCTICMTFSKWQSQFQKLKHLRLEECCQREVWNHIESQLQSRATEALQLCWSFSNYCTRVTEKYECREAHKKKVSRNGKAHRSILDLWQEEEVQSSTRQLDRRREEMAKLTTSSDGNLDLMMNWNIPSRLNLLMPSM